MVRFGQSQIYSPNIQRKKLAKIFLKIFGTIDTSSSHLHFIRIVKNIAKKINFNHVLDAGCGKGRFTFWLAQKYSNARIDACDLSETNIDVCKEIQTHLKIRNINFFVQDLLTYKRKGFYDFIFSNHVLEHVIENRLVLSNLVSSLKNGGYIYIQIPNAVQRRLPIGKKFVKTHEEWAKNEHIGQTLTLDLLSSELKNEGCEILKARHTEGFWGELRFELSEMALNYFHNYIIFLLLYPLLKIFGYIDSLVCNLEGNGILILAKKKL